MTTLTLLHNFGSLTRPYEQISCKSISADVLQAVKEALANMLDSANDSKPAPVAWKVPHDTTNGAEEPANTFDDGGT